jgi:hypothetical protein
MSRKITADRDRGPENWSGCCPLPTRHRWRTTPPRPVVYQLASVAGMLLVMLGSPAISLFGQPPAGSVMSACQGRLRPLLVILQRENQAPNEMPRPGRNPTEVSGVDALIDVGG